MNARPKALGLKGNSDKNVNSKIILMPQPVYTDVRGKSIHSLR